MQFARGLLSTPVPVGVGATFNADHAIEALVKLWSTLFRKSVLDHAGMPRELYKSATTACLDFQSKLLMGAGEAGQRMAQVYAATRKIDLANQIGEVDLPRRRVHLIETSAVSSLRTPHFCLLQPERSRSSPSPAWTAGPPRARTGTSCGRGAARDTRATRTPPAARRARVRLPEQRHRLSVDERLWRPSWDQSTQHQPGLGKKTQCRPFMCMLVDSQDASHPEKGGRTYCRSRVVRGATREKTSVCSKKSPGKPGTPEVMPTRLRLTRRAPRTRRARGGGRGGRGEWY